MAQEDYRNAMQILEKIIDYENTGYKEKNSAEEFMAYVKQKMDI